MDISVLASVGSFWVSERVLKPKASILILLGCLLAYDLTTKTHDSSSLRVYRGPGLLAFSLMMVALSLRYWRRNGVACDELLFLPGTPHEESTESSTCRNNNNNNSSSSSTINAQNTSPVRVQIRSEGDVAAGGWQNRNSNDKSNNKNVCDNNNNQSSSSIQMVSQLGRARSLSRDSSLSSINEFADQWDLDETSRHDNDHLIITSTHDEIEIVDEELAEMAPLKNNNNAGTSESVMSSRHERSNSITAGSERSMHAVRSSSQQQQQQHNNHNDNIHHNDNHSHSVPHTRVERFVENHPRITRIGTLFFFRSSSIGFGSNNAAYAPSAPSVMGAALDLSMPILFNFHLFIEAWNHLDSYENDTPAKILPLIFLSVLIFRTGFPPKRRGRFWNTIKFTATAPFHDSRFRDIYLGDVLTSLVRPIQDIVFALAYYFTVIWGTITSKYNLSDSGSILETSWLLHNVVLPSCALLPLWWKFLQTLRECYDTRKRWPHLGNAFKYLSAALVILYGMTHHENVRSPWWILAFGSALVYQIVWDTVIDWELLVIAPKEGEGLDVSETSSWVHGPISSVRPDSYWILLMHRLTAPLRDFVRSTFGRLPHWKQIQLRPRRLYKSEKFYWRIFIYNTIFRFCWMLSFIPAYHLSASGRHVVTTFSSDTKSYVGVLLPVAEIIRRTLWGFLYLEIETIRMTDGNPSYQYEQVEILDGTSPDETELSSNSVDSSKISSRHYLPAWLGMQHPQLQQHNEAATSSALTSSSTSPSKITNLLFKYSDETRDKLFVIELGFWAAAFVGLGIWATT